MHKIKEITVFTNGDSKKLSTWSNVPYFFTETLKAKGLKVNRVDIGPSRLLNKVYNITFWRILKLINRDNTSSYYRSCFHYLNVRRRIKKSIRKYESSDANIFLTFSFTSAGLTDKPTILFGDWTYDHYFKYFANRRPDYFERSCIKREDQQIEKSDLILPLFPAVAVYMKSRYKNQNIYYLGNVVNSLIYVTESEVLKKKSVSNNILFIGNKKYAAGAEYLIKAYKSLKKRFPQLSLNIVGMANDDFVELPEGVSCYGYLDKAKDRDRELYYSLLINAKVFVNTTPKWGGFSATIEAMYFYNPVIVSPYDEFVKTFGYEIRFGDYCENNSTALLCSKIEKIIEDRAYVVVLIIQSQFVLIKIQDRFWNCLNILPW